MVGSEGLQHGEQNGSVDLAHSVQLVHVPRCSGKVRANFQQEEQLVTVAEVFERYVNGLDSSAS